ncbi:homing endonuclease associated repeat-containing protein [Halobacterium noricense]|uniref:homing endonuclease associated repeat-containing protein n=1 Tax=Halobacterium noricense TaxID=223182 RepID=UPI001E556747|nr:hypothetical protein [Halobacterium noricense]UHH26680.1 hypothetical protein LT974_07050 [Halobacterium noricense]
MPTYSDEELLTEIDRLAEKFGRPPTLQEIREEAEYSARVYFSHFGSWQSALETAGYEPRPPQSEIPKEALITELKRLGEELGRPPTITEMNEQGEYWGSTYKNHFESWAAAIDAAGYDPDNVGQRISSDKLRTELTRLGDKLNKRPTFREVEEQGKYDPTTYIRRYGSWSAAVEAAGFEPPSDLTKDALCTELQRLANKLDKQPTQRDMNEHGKHSHTTYVRHFGSWTNAIEAAFD